MEKQKSTLFNSYNNDGLTYQDYVEFCEMEKIMPAEEDSEEANDWIHDTVAAMYEYMIDMFQIETPHYPVLITGAREFWNNNTKISPRYAKSISDAVDLCMSNDWDDIEVRFNDGVLEIDAAYDRDVTYHFIIYKLSPNGIDAVNEHDENKGLCVDYEPDNSWFEPIKADEVKH